ncbi:MAG TPA: 3-phosphoshikimate 1-carboxyvinyltransferase [Acidimicrobiia bacterium]|nr:3-phosphoshikimate 1-carboxyvinyltransferase [Acidimicrobiia bacterium]
MSSPAVITPLRRPVEAVVRPPGSKSLTNRALVTAALARGVSRLSGPLEADDTQAMRAGLGLFGVSIDDADDPWLVLGRGGELETPTSPIDAIESGTTARFLAALASLVTGKVEIIGQGRLPQRPFRELASALASLGIEVQTHHGGLPMSIAGKGELPGGRVAVDPSRSSQFVTALLLVAPMASRPLEVEMKGPPVSAPYLQSTVEVMTAFGAAVAQDGLVFQVANTGYRSSHFEIEADASAAAYPLVAAAITGGRVAIQGIPRESIQPDLALVEVLAGMGCEVRRGEFRLELAGPSQLEPVDVEMERAPDATLALAVACLFATGPSRIRRVGNLRLKESDRLLALAEELTRVGGEARVEGDDLIVTPGKLREAKVDSHGDHRIAMALALVGLRQAGIEIAEPEVVRKTWPRYFEMLGSL